ncbi:zinc-dependent metalloprotease [Streptomyces sp. NP160]|nr:zinc-dependent metalloprotease [Streptomyces sp. NP160]
MAQAMAAVQQLMASAGDGPVNWQLAHDVARQAAVAEGDPAPSSSDEREVSEALRLADLWLDPVTDLTSAAAAGRAWSRSEWVEATLPTWKRLAEPVASSVADAVASAMAEQVPEEARGMVAGASSMMRSIGGTVFGAQLGQAVGGLSREVVSATDVGIPLVAGSTTALLPSGVAAFADGLGVPAGEVRLFLAARESAHARLFAGVPWLRGHLLGSVEAYARGITLDTSRIEEAVRNIDPSDPTALQEALGSGVLEPEKTPAQQAALERLETALALVEGWVDHVVDQATRSTLPSSAALREAARRRRAVGGPAEHVMAGLVGLELRPRRLREASRLWEAVEAARGAEGRDAVWAHPDLLPTPADLDDPEGFATRRSDAEAASADVDAALEALLRGEETRGDDPRPEEHRPDGDDDAGSAPR